MPNVCLGFSFCHYTVTGPGAVKLKQGLRQSCKFLERNLMQALITIKCAVENFLLWNVYISWFNQVSNSVYIDSLSFPAVIKHYRKVETSHRYRDIYRNNSAFTTCISFLNTSRQNSPFLPGSP